MTQNFSNEHQIREHVKVLKSFYEEFSFYALICLGLIVIWLLSGAGYFWPIWVIVIWGAPLLLKASRIGVIDGAIYELFNRLRHTLPIFKADWEEEKTQQLLYRHDIHEAPKAVAKTVTNTAKQVTSKASSAAKSTVKKAKATVKKAAPAVKKAVSTAKAATAKTASTTKKTVAKAKKPVQKAVKKVAPTAKKGTSKKSAAKPSTKAPDKKKK